MNESREIIIFSHTYEYLNLFLGLQIFNRTCPNEDCWKKAARMTSNSQTKNIFVQASTG